MTALTRNAYLIDLGLTSLGSFKTLLTLMKSGFLDVVVFNDVFGVTSTSVHAFGNKIDVVAGLHLVFSVSTGDEHTAIFHLRISRCAGI